MSLKKLETEKKQFYLTKIESTISLKKLYLKSDFTLQKLAKETEIQLNFLSYLINSEINCHFRDYVNLKRIEYFKEKINDSQWEDFTIERMIMASGFKSRATSHRAFLKHIGMCPSEYLKSHRTEFNHLKVSKTSRYNYG